jgi:hypothetical protein
LTTIFSSWIGPPIFQLRPLDHELTENAQVSIDGAFCAGWLGISLSSAVVVHKPQVFGLRFKTNKSSLHLANYLPRHIPPPQSPHHIFFCSRLCMVSWWFLFLFYNRQVFFKIRERWEEKQTIEYILREGDWLQTFQRLPLDHELAENAQVPPYSIRFFKYMLLKIWNYANKKRY